jgi:hypothetical protein
MAEMQYCVCGHTNIEHTGFLKDLLQGEGFKCRKCNCKEFKIKED